MMPIKGVMLRRGRARLENGVVITVKDRRFCLGDQIFVNYDYTRGKVAGIELRKEVDDEYHAQYEEPEPIKSWKHEYDEQA